MLKKTPEANIPFSDFVMLARALDEKSLVILLGEIGNCSGHFTASDTANVYKISRQLHETDVSRGKFDEV